MIFMIVISELLRVDNPWLTFSLMFMAAWAVIFISRPRVRREMLVVSLLTMPFALSEPVFVPRYWSPPSLFNLAATTGFDIESFIFCFAIGGIGSVLYEALTGMVHKQGKANPSPVANALHAAAILSPLITFNALELLAGMNPIYSASISMLLAAVLSLIFRPDLVKETFAGGAVFTGMYFIFFLLFTALYPGIVERVWNLPALSGILVVGIPAEELMFAFCFGSLWSGAYENVTGYRIRKTLSSGA